MPALLRKFNYRNIVLTDVTEAESVGVLDENDYPRYFPWAGFIDADVLGPHAVIVRLEIHAWSVGDGYCEPWRPLPHGKHVRGCQIGRGVCAVIRGSFPEFG